MLALSRRVSRRPARADGRSVRLRRDPGLQQLSVLAPARRARASHARLSLGRCRRRAFDRGDAAQGAAVGRRRLRPGRARDAEGPVGDGRALHDLRSLPLHPGAVARGRRRRSRDASRGHRPSPPHVRARGVRRRSPRSLDERHSELESARRRPRSAAGVGRVCRALPQRRPARHRRPARGRRARSRSQGGHHGACRHAAVPGRALSPWRRLGVRQPAELPQDRHDLRRSTALPRSCSTIAWRPSIPSRPHSTTWRRPSSGSAPTGRATLR